MGRFARILLSTILAAYAVQAMAAATISQLDNMRAHGLAWLYTHQQGDGSWQTAVGFKLQPTGLAIDALGNAGLKSAYPVTAAQAWITNANASSNDSLARQTIAIARSGANAQASAQRLIGQRDGLTLGWGAYKQYQGGFPDSALAMDAILASGLTYADTGSSLGFIISHQNLDGGWPNSATEPGIAASHLIPSAHSVYTLSRYRPLGWGVDSYITNGVNWLKSIQKPDGGFAEDSSATSGNPYDTALAYLALNQAKLAANSAAVAAQIAIDNAQQFLVNSQSADGSWGGDALATALALQTVPSAALVDTDHDGIPDVVENLIGTNPNVADARLLAGGNGSAVSGLTVAKLLTNATLGQPFNYTIIAGGGVAPYKFSLTSGILPDGLTLNTTSGAISGTPSRVGPFNFAFSVSDANNLGISAQQGQIQVAALNAGNDNDVPTLPEWGAILMALLLLAAQFRRNLNNR